MVKVKIFDDIERLRGFACILVLIQHIAWICPINFIYELVPTRLLFGKEAVRIFFAISGFVVTLSLRNKLSPISGYTFLERLMAAKKDIILFYKKRFFRIFPVMFFTVVLTGISLSVSEKDFSWLQSLLLAPFEILVGSYANIVELFVYQEKIHVGGIGPFWTLAIEAQFYIFWPIIFLLCKNDNIRAIVALSLGCVFLFLVYPLLFIMVGKKYYLPHNNLSELFLGAFFAFLYNENVKREFNKKIAMLISIILALIIWSYPSFMQESYFSNIVPCISSVAIVVLAAFLKGSFDIPLFNKIFDFLGSRSYSFYALQLVLANI
ncbi:MAG: acyltransferase, partial [Holosporaceae bacterium]|nr:acyltransferase [Holosporaceae bacterium]